MKVMIPFTDFYDDIVFMAALFFNGMLHDAHIYEVASRLHNKKPDDVLAQIIANGADGNNKGLFHTYLEAFGIKFLDPKRALIAKMFYYILHNRMDLYKGINFINFKVRNNENITKYVGDDVGIEKLLGAFYAVTDGDLRDEKDIEAAITDVFKEMKQYVRDNPVHISMDTAIAEDNEKTVTKTEMEKARAKALAKGIEMRDYYDKAWGEPRKNKHTD
jgi:hypothetical protein